MARYHFGRFTLDERAGELREGETLITLQPKSYELLLLLVQEPGVLFSREQLFERLWPGVHVSDGSLSQAVRRLRLALGGDDSLLQTLPKRGYRFIAAVEQLPDTPEPAPQPQLYALPGPAPSSLLGREELIAEARRLMAAPSFVITLHGPGGIGKTTLAKVITPGALWIPLGGIEHRDDLLQRVSSSAGISLEGPRDALLSLGRALCGVDVVFDEAERCCKPLSELIAAIVKPKCVVTSRKLLGIGPEQVLPLPPLSPDDAMRLWHRLAPGCEGDIAGLLAKLDHHPLAIELAAKRAPLLRADGLLRRLSSRGIGAFDQQAPKSSLVQIAEESWSAISEPARRCLSVAVCLPAPVQLEDIESASGDLDLLDPMDELRASAWIRPEGQGWAVPAPLAEWLAANVARPDDVCARAAARIAERARAGEELPAAHVLWALEQGLSPADIVALTWRLSRRERNRLPSASHRRLLERAEAALLELPAPAPDDEAHLLHERALCMGKSSWFKDSLPLIERALSIPASAKLRAEIWRSRVMTLGVCGRTSEARAEAALLLEWAEQQGVPEALMHALAAEISAKSSLGAPIEALVERGLEIARRLGIREQLFFLEARARDLASQARFADSLVAWKAALAAASRIDEVSFVVQIEIGLANVLARLDPSDESGEARALYHSTAARADRYGLTYAAIKARSSLAHLLMMMDDPSAEAALLDSLQDAESTGIPERILMSRLNLGVLYAKRGALAQAESCFQAARASPHRATVLIATGYLAQVAIDLGDLPRAEALLEEIEPGATYGSGKSIRASVEGRLIEARQRVVSIR